MENSKPIYVLCNNGNTIGTLWETSMGKILTLSGNLEIQYDLLIYDVEKNEDIKSVDLRNVLMSLLPQE